MKTISFKIQMNKEVESLCELCVLNEDENPFIKQIVSKFDKEVEKKRQTLNRQLLRKEAKVKALQAEIDYYEMEISMLNKQIQQITGYLGKKYPL